jgi:hypothetical protein
LQAVLPEPDAKTSYELIGVGKRGMKIATELQDVLSGFWKNPLGLSIIIPKPRKNAKTSWVHTCVDCNPKFHTRKLLIDSMIYTGRTYKELMGLYPTAYFASLYSFKEFPNCYYAEKIDKNSKINFPNETEEV